MAFRDFVTHLFLKYLAVPKTPEVLPGKIHIACLGDSITFGAGVMGQRDLTWEHFLNQILGDGVQVINYGISGRTLQDEGDYPYKRDKFYNISLRCGAEIYLIMLGTNDAKPYNWDKERYRRELKAFVSEYSALSHHPSVILMTPPQCFEDPKLGKVGFDIDKETIDCEIVPVVKETAAEKGLHVIDLHAFTQDHRDWFSDGVHPNETGNREIARFLADQLREIGLCQSSQQHTPE